MSSLSLEKPVPGKNSLLYCPTPKQFEFHAGRGVYYERAALCGGGAGKTICGLFEDVRWALDFPGSVGVRSWDNPESMEGANIDYIHLDEARLILHLDTALLTAKRRRRGSGRCKVPVDPAL